MSQCFAKRLTHLGFETYVVGETTVPSISKNDLLIVASGSGKTLATVNVVKLAKLKKVKVNLITANSKSILSEIADVTIEIPCITKFDKSRKDSIQPLNTLFEQCLLVFFDLVVLMLKEKLKITEKEMLARHSNLE
jgi:6-phospho-3-hexuloisomerase